MSKIKIGLIGLGTVGSGVVKTLKHYPDVEIEKIAVRDITKKRDIEGLNTSMLTQNPEEIVNSPDIDIVVEVMGGLEPAFSLLKTAVKSGKHIITANKELLAKHGQELFALAKENNVVILYEAAIAGGIPIIMPIKMTLSGNKINKIAAILNGTTNYILTKMDTDNSDYKDVLKEAQELGYAEADPTSDVEGYDSAYKLATLATIAFNKRIDINKIHREGISNVSARDIEFAREFGYKIKLIALAQMDDNGKADVRVHPMLVPKTHILASVDNVTNAVMLEGHPVGQVVFTGPGAGEFPTASSVVGDILVLAAGIEKTDHPLPMMRCEHTESATQLDISETNNRYYISIKAKNIPGVIGIVGSVCGLNNINMSSVLQKGVRDDNTAEIVVITADSKEQDMQNAVKALEENQFIEKINNIIRVMN